MSRILAFVDGSGYSESVCDHTAWLAKRMKASVSLMHVLGRRDMSADAGDLTGALDVDAREVLLAELADLDAQKARLAQQRGRMVLDSLQAKLNAQGINDVTVKLRIEDLVETVTEFERDADVIVVGKRGSAADFARLHLGSNLERIVRASHRPVLVASRAFKPMTRALIAFDGGDSAQLAVRYLVKQAALFKDMSLRMLKVGDCTENARQKLEAAAHSLRQCGYQVSADVLPGHAETVIAEQVTRGDIDLLIMGAYGHSRIRSLIIGSTTTEMIRSCKIPVVLFR